MTKKELIRLINKDSLLSSYFETALWASTDESDESGGEPLDANHSIEDFTIEGLKRMIAMTLDFVGAPGVADAINATLDDWGLAGHDLWLTQNGHGAGFWDGDWPEPEATLLTEAAHRVGGADIYVGDNGRLYVA